MSEWASQHAHKMQMAVLKARRKLARFDAVLEDSVSNGITPDTQRELRESITEAIRLLQSPALDDMIEEMPHAGFLTTQDAEMRSAG